MKFKAEFLALLIALSSCGVGIIIGQMINCYKKTVRENIANCIEDLSDRQTGAQLEYFKGYCAGIYNGDAEP